MRDTSSGNCISSKGNFMILAIGHEYVVVNKEKSFSQGHTHVKSFSQAEYLVKMSLHKRIPHHLSSYLLTSLIRLSDDAAYSAKIAELIGVKESRAQRYTNRVAS